jgi:hypothetical protein
MDTQITFEVGHPVAYKTLRIMKDVGEITLIVLFYVLKATWFCAKLAIVLVGALCWGMVLKGSAPASKGNSFKTTRLYK